MKNIKEGIRVNGDDVIFDFLNDTENDIIPLKFQKFNKKLSTRSGVEMYFGYRYNENVNVKDLSIVRDSIKMLTANKSDIKLMIMKAINGYLKLTNNIPDIIITPKSSGPLVNYIAQLFKDKLGNSTLIATDSILKSDITDIQIDPNKLKNMDLKQQQNIQNIIKSATKSGSFKMKSIPIPMRRIVINFMKLKPGLDKEILNKIINGNILLLDDIYTGGSTFNEMIRILSQYEPKKINGFVLLLSK